MVIGSLCLISTNKNMGKLGTGKRSFRKETNQIWNPLLQRFSKCKLTNARNVLNCIGLDGKTVDSVMFLGPDVF